MDLLDSLLTLSKEGGKRELSRTHLYAAVLSVVIRLTDIVRIGDAVTVEGRVYCLRKVVKNDGHPVYIITVDNGRGPAILGDRVIVKPFLPHASYEEHVIFAEQTKAIIDAFCDLMRTETARAERAEQEAISEGQFVERII